MRESEIGATQVQGDFADHLEVSKVNKSKNQRLGGKMGGSKSIISAMKDTIRNTFVKWRMRFPEAREPKSTLGN